MDEQRQDATVNASVVEAGVQQQNVGEQINTAPGAGIPETQELTPDQRAKMEKQQKLYKILQQGGLFLKFIHNDIEQQKRKQLNRAQRRRFERSINKGQFTKEIIEVYYERLQEIQAYIDGQLNPVAPVDGAELLAKLRAENCAKEGGKCDCGKGEPCKNAS